MAQTNPKDLILQLYSHGFKKKEKNPEEIIKESTDIISDLKKEKTKINVELNSCTNDLSKYKNKKPEQLSNIEKKKLIQLLTDQRRKLTRIENLSQQINTVEKSINIYQETDIQIKTNKNLANLNEITKSLKVNIDLNEIEDTLADTQENNDQITEINQLINDNNNKMENIDEKSLLEEFFDVKDDSYTPDMDDLLSLNNLKTSVTNNQSKINSQPVVNEDDEFDNQLSNLPVIKSKVTLPKNQYKIVSNNKQPQFNQSYEDLIWGK